MRSVLGKRSGVYEGTTSAMSATPPRSIEYCAGAEEFSAPPGNCLTVSLPPESSASPFANGVNTDLSSVCPGPRKCASDSSVRSAADPHPERLSHPAAIIERSPILTMLHRSSACIRSSVHPVR